MIVCGCDVGSSAVKFVLMEAETERLLFAHKERLRKRNPIEVVALCFSRAKEAGFDKKDFSYIAATGESDYVSDGTGIFYAMTCHARGARHFFPDTDVVIDLGALHMRAMKLDDKGRIQAFKVTSQCASGTGQFVENISRYLGLTLEELEALSLSSRNPQEPSNICAVLAETDIINMVSRGVPLPDIIRGVHNAISRRAIKLLHPFLLASHVTLTGGLAMDEGLTEAMVQLLHTESLSACIRRCEMAIYAGAVGAALWGGQRCCKAIDVPR